MTSSKVLDRTVVTNARELQHTLDTLFNTHDISPDEIVVFGSNGEPLLVRLIEDTLTDGSKVYNINIE
jgi:hypothetical protein